MTHNSDPHAPLEAAGNLCYAIGLGAALTPVGEPLSGNVVAKVGTDFWFLFHLLLVLYCLALFWSR
jgi:predicted cation transporter